MKDANLEESLVSKNLETNGAEDISGLVLVFYFFRKYAIIAKAQIWAGSSVLV